MICPKCKTEVSPQDVICPKCKLRLHITCPRCGSVARLGSSSCKKCGFVFVKFCPKCNSANYVSATQCRKCFYNFPSDNAAGDEKNKEKATAQSNPSKSTKSKEQAKPSAANVKLAVLIDFITLKNVFDKYKDEEFKQKVLLNIKTSVKMSFNVACEFVSENVVMFKMNYVRKLGILPKIENFKQEFTKFNNILLDTLGIDITYKFAIIKEEEYAKNTKIEQLSLGIEQDIITSEDAYKILNDEISLIKITHNSYKMVFLDQRPEFMQSETTAPEVAFDLIADAIEDDVSEIKAISLNAPRGFGKTHLLNALQDKFEDTQTILLLGQCTPLTQITPLGLFQDIFLALFKLTFAPSKYEKRVRDVRELLAKSFPSSSVVNSDAIDTLINIVYPSKEDYYENILENKQKTFENLKIILEMLRADNKLVLIIDDFDLIDEASFEFLKYLIQNDFFSLTTKLLLAYKNQQAIGMYITSDKLPKNACLNINLAQKSIGDIKGYLKNRFGDEDILPEKIMDQLIAYAQGNFAYIEQVLNYFVESNKIFSASHGFEFDKVFENFCIPPSLEETLDLRYEILKESFQKEYKFINLASLLGGKFNKSVLAKVLKLDGEDFFKIANSLIDKGYIKKISEDSFIFKNNLLWSHIYNFAKNNEDLRDLQIEFLHEICQKTVTSHAIKALIAQTTEDKKLAFELWTQNLKYASYIGDVGLYILSQKQSLSLLGNATLSDPMYVKNNICERVGKLTYEKNPQEAMNFLSNAVAWAQKKGDDNKVVELSGYLIQSCKAVQNYPAIIETVDAVLEIYSKPKMELQRALIKTRKLHALLQIGNWGEIANLVNIEINPILQNYLKRPKNLPYGNVSDIYKTYLESNIVLVEAYAQQGNPLVFELIEELEKEIFKEKNKQADFLEIKLDLAMATALAYTSKGLIKVSDDILQSIVKDFSYMIDDSRLVSKWNTIDIFNKIIKMDYDKIKDDLFEVVSFADNCGDNYGKNILKILLAHVLLSEGNALKALEICSAQMTYFSNEKIALGALIAWYISAKATFLTDGLDRAIEICEKSIKICKNSKINSIFFNILFNKLLAQVYLAKGELDSAKMYSELALQEAVSNELIYLQLELYRVRALCMQEGLKAVEEAKRLELMQATVKIFEKAIGIANKLGMTKHHYLIQKDLTAFKAHCQLNGIIQKS